MIEDPPLRNPIPEDDPKRIVQVPVSTLESFMTTGSLKFSASGPRLVFFALLGSGLLLSVALHFSDLGSNRILGHNIFFHLFARHEWIVVLLLLLWFFVWGDRAGGTLKPPGRKLIWGLALGAVLIAAGGAAGVMRFYPLSADDFLMTFQARTYAEGVLFPQVGAPWLEFENLLRGSFIRFREETQQWTPQYLPVHAAILALFGQVGAAMWVNPLANAASILILVAISRRLWPDRPETHGLASLLLFESSQFHIWGMSWHSSAMHLFFNLLWIWLWLRPERWALGLLPWLGGLAMGLHQPHVHWLIALPFLGAMVGRRRWRALIYLGMVYAGFGGLWLWFMWQRGVGSGAAEAGMQWIPSLNQVVYRWMHAILIATWNHPLAVLGTLGALVYWRRLPTASRCLLAGVLLSFFFYLAFRGHGGHGWGSRYSHPILGHLALLAVAVWNLQPAVRISGFSLSPGGLVPATVLCLVLLLPIRCGQVGSFVAPYARVDAAINSMDADVVLIRGLEGYYAWDLLRNDPFLRERPVRMRGWFLNPQTRASLERRFRVMEVGRQEFGQHGLPLISPEVEMEWMRKNGTP